MLKPWRRCATLWGLGTVLLRGRANLPPCLLQFLCTLLMISRCMVLVPLSHCKLCTLGPVAFKVVREWHPRATPVLLVATRNNPLENANPAFIVFPTNATQVAASVRFAVKHNLCIMVAGTGHDFLNRHSCTMAYLFVLRSCRPSLPPRLWSQRTTSVPRQ